MHAGNDWYRQVGHSEVKCFHFLASGVSAGLSSRSLNQDYIQPVINSHKLTGDHNQPTGPLRSFDRLLTLQDPL
jgi:hypothetical protein